MTVVLGLLPALGFGVAGIFARVGLQNVKTSTGTVVTVASSFLVAATAALIVEFDAIIDLSPKAFIWFFATGMLTYPVARFLNYTAVTIIGATRASVFISIQPLFAAFFAMLFLGERPGWLISLGTLIIVLALALIATEAQGGRLSPTQIDKRFLLGCLIGLTAGAGYGSSNILAKQIVSDYAPALVGVAFSLLFGGAAMVVLAGRDVLSIPKIPGKSLLILGLAGLSAAGAVTSLFFALSRARVIVVSPLVATFPLVTLILAHIFLQRLERITWRVLLGTSLVVAGVILVILGRG